MDKGPIEENQEFIQALDFSFAASASNQRLSEEPTDSKIQDVTQNLLSSQESTVNIFSNQIQLSSQLDSQLLSSRDHSDLRNILSLNLQPISSVQNPRESLKMPKQIVNDSEQGSDQTHKVCRICFAGEDNQNQVLVNNMQPTEINVTLRNSSRAKSNEANESSQNSKDCQIGEQSQIPYVKNEALLKEICKCKGTLKYVHESCLIKWLTQANTQRCELCLQYYNISYEFGSIKEVAYNGFNFAVRDKKRLVRGLLYALYLWIFFRRFIHMIVSITKFMKKCIHASIKQIHEQKKLPTQHAQKMQDIFLVFSKAKDINNKQISDILQLNNQNMNQNNLQNRMTQRLRKFLSINTMVTTIIGLIGFFYRVFIFIQMCCLGYGESLRIKKYVKYILMNSRKLKINKMDKNDKIQ